MIEYSFPQIVHEDEDTEEVNERIKENFMDCYQLGDDEEWGRGGNLNQPGFYTKVSSAGDGNCFFWSLAQALYFLKNNKTVRDITSIERKEWKKLAAQLRQETAETINKEMYDGKVFQLSFLKNYRASKSMKHELGSLESQLRSFKKKHRDEMTKKTGKVDPARHRFNEIERVLDALNATRATAFQDIDFRKSLFIANEPNDTKFGAPKNMRIFRYYLKGNAKKH